MRKFSLFFVLGIATTILFLSSATQTFASQLLERFIPQEIPLSNETGCATIYQEDHYKGEDRTLCIGEYNEGQLESFSNNLGGAIIPNGVEVTFYTGSNFDGSSSKFNLSNVDLKSEPIENCTNVGDCTKSIVVTELSEDENIINRNVLLITFNPFLPSQNKSLIEYGQTINWQNPYELNQNLLSWFNNTNKVHYSVADNIEYNNFIPKKDGFIYDETTYLHCIENSPENCHVPDDVDYEWIVDQFDICERVNNSEIDEVWLQGGMNFGFYESILIGPNAYAYNGSPIIDVSCDKNVPIMGFNYERTLTEMKHDFGHRIEATMMQFYGYWNASGNSNEWEKFSVTDFLSSEQAYSGCGNTHYTPNSQDDYDYANADVYVDTYCDEFLNYPNINYENLTLKNINCEEWGCDGNGYFDYWFGHLPDKQGKSPSGLLNNWWIYLAEPNSVFANTSELSVENNIAKNKKVTTKTGTTSTSFGTNGYKSYELADLNNLNSVTLNNDSKFFYIDLENQYSISNIKIQSDVINDPAVKLEFSVDAYHWKESTELYPVNSVGAISRSIPMANIPARFIRLSLTDESKQYNFSEIEVAGEPYVSTNLPPIVDAGSNFIIAQENTTLTFQGIVSDPEGDDLEYVWSWSTSHNLFSTGVDIKSPNSLTTEVEIGDLPDRARVQFKLKVYDSHNMAVEDNLVYATSTPYGFDITRIETSPINTYEKNLSGLFNGYMDPEEAEISYIGTDLGIILEFNQPHEYQSMEVAFGHNWDVYAANSWEDMINNNNVLKIADSIETTDEGMQTINFPKTTAKIFKIVSKSENSTLLSISELQILPVNKPPTFQEIPTIEGNEDEVIPSLNLSDYVMDPEGDTISFSVIKTPNLDNLSVSLNRNNSISVDWKKSNWFGSDNVIIEAVDSHGNKAEKQIDIVINPVNDSPSLEIIPVVTLDEDSTIFPQVDLSPYILEPDGEAVTWKLRDSLSRSNIKFNIDPVTGKVTITSLTPDFNGTGTYTVNVTDASGTIASGQLTITVNPINDKPTVQTIVNQEVLAGKTFQYQVKASDVDNQPLIYTLTAAPVGMTISPTGLINWKTGPLQKGNKTVTVEVSDGELKQSVTFIVRVFQIYY